MFLCVRPRLGCAGAEELLARLGLRDDAAGEDVRREGERRAARERLGRHLERGVVPAGGGAAGVHLRGRAHVQEQRRNLPRLGVLRGAAAEAPPERLAGRGDGLGAREGVLEGRGGLHDLALERRRGGGELGHLLPEAVDRQEEVDDRLGGGRGGAVGRAGGGRAGGASALRGSGGGGRGREAVRGGIDKLWGGEPGASAG